MKSIPDNLQGQRFMADGQSQRMHLLLEAPIPTLLWRLAAPNAVATVVLTSVAVADAWFVGRLGTAALASLAIVFPFQTLIQMMAGGAIGGGVTSALSRAVGAGDKSHADAIAWHSIVIASVASIPFIICLGLLPATAFALLGGQGQVLGGAVAYAQIAFGGATIIWVFYILCAILRGTGNTQTPARAIVLSSIAQIGLSGLLTLGYGPFPSFGVIGPALAIVVCQGLAVLYLIFKLLDPDSPIDIRPQRLRWRPFADIMQVGGIGLLNSLMAAGTVLVATGFIGHYGTAALAGYGLSGRLELMLVPIAFGVGAALTAGVGINFGAGQYARARSIAWAGAWVVFVITGAIGLGVWLVPDWWLGRFTADQDAYSYGELYLSIVAPFYGLFGFGQALYFASQGTGRLFFPVCVSVFRMLVIVLCGWLAIGSHWDVSYLFVIAAVSLTIMGIGQALCLFTPAWRPDIYRKTRAAK
ncbi:MAG: MATE family efflux transporter [Hyphomicrobiaceae bacterium]